MTEVWIDITGYEGLYQVSNTGRIKSLPKRMGNGVGVLLEESIRIPVLSKHGYHNVRLRKNCVGRNYQIHRLVAEAFIPNPEGKRTVNHKNGIKTDNRVENLEWATHGENMKHAYSNLGKITPTKGRFGRDHHRAKPVIQYTAGGLYVKQWDGVMEIERALGIGHKSISMCCNGKYKTAGGYKWAFAETTKS